VAQLLEAHGPGLWPADKATSERLQALYGDLEDRPGRLTIEAEAR